MSKQDAFRYAAFISYSHRDEKHAAWLHRALETYRAPEGVALPPDLPNRERRLNPVFRDREELSSSHDLSVSIREALSASHALIVICSPAAAKSRWVNEEVKEFKRLHGEERVFALIVEGEDNGSEPFFPEALLQKIGPDGEVLDDRGEPLAADIRPGKDGKRHAKLKLAAGLLDVGLDSLAQRDAARERKQMMRLTGAAVAGMTVFAAVAVWAIFAQMEANKQKKIAEREAMTATRTAEFMVDLFSVADPGEAQGQKVLAKDILDQGVRRIGEGLADEPEVQATLMYTMARARTGLGLYGDAVELFEKTRDLREAADADRLEVFTIESALARALFEKNDGEDIDAARPVYSRLVAEAESQILEEKWDPVYADVIAGLAELELRKGDLELSKTLVEKALQYFADNRDTNSLMYANALHVYAGALLFSGELDEARKKLNSAKQIYEEKKGQDFYRIGIIYNDWANVEYFSGNFVLAQEYLEKALDIYTIHLEAYHPEVGITKSNLSRLYYENGDVESATALLTEAIKIEQENNRDDQSDFGFFLNTMGLLEFERGQYEQATANFSRAAELITDSANPVFGTIRINLGRAHCEQGRVDEGLTLIAEGRNALPGLYGEGDWPFGIADEFEARCLAKQGDATQAKMLARSAYETLLNVNGPDHYFTQRANVFLASLE